MINKLDLHDHNAEDYSVSIDTINNYLKINLNKLIAFDRYWNLDSTQIIKTNLGLNGLIDYVSLQHDALYFIWAVFNSTVSTLKGFGISKRPEATLSSITSGGNLGTVLTCDVTNNVYNTAYQFTPGSRVRIFSSYINYNLGTVISITDGNTIVIQLDNDSRYGTNLSSTGHKIIQMDKFVVYNVSESFSSATQTEYANETHMLNYAVKTDISGLFEKIIKVSDLFSESVQEPYQNNSIALNSQTGIRFSDINESLQMSNSGLYYYDIMPNVMRNVIHNTALNIWQRGTTATNIPNLTVVYLADRIYSIHYQMAYTTVPTIERSAIVPSNQPFQYSALLKNLEVRSPLPANSWFHGFWYTVEGYDFRPLVGKRCTLSFWVRSSKIGIYTLCFRNSGYDRSYVSEYTINTANTWEFKTITLDFDYSGGTWNYINGAGLHISWNVSMNTAAITTTTPNQWLTGNYANTSNQVNWADSNTATFYITGIQLHEGDKALQYIPRSLEQELSICQRYYEKSFDLSVAPANINTNIPFYVGHALFNDYLLTTIYYKVRKRINTNSIIFYNDNGGTAGTWDYYSNGVLITNNTVSVFRYNEYQFTPIINDVGVMTVDHAYTLNGHWTASADL